MQGNGKEKIERGKETMKKTGMLFAGLLAIVLTTTALSPSYVYAASGGAKKGAAAKADGPIEIINEKELAGEDITEELEKERIPSEDISDEFSTEEKDIPSVDITDRFKPNDDTELEEPGSEADKIEKKDKKTDTDGSEADTDDEEKDGSRKKKTAKIKVKKLPASERVIYVPQKCKLREAVSILPSTWKVILENGEEKDVQVSWKCMDDFKNAVQTSFVFQGAIEDKEIAASVSRKMLSRIRMEIYFEDQLWLISDSSGDIVQSEIPMHECPLSPNSILPEIDKEEDAAEYDENFVNDYGKKADTVIKTARNFVGENTVLPDKTASIMRSISPASGDYYYAQFSKEEKKFYNRIDSYVTQYLYYGKEPSGTAAKRTTAFISYEGLSRADAVRVFAIYYYNNPQAFFLTIGLNETTSGEPRMAFNFLPDASTPEKLADRAVTIADTLAAFKKEIKKQETEYDKLRVAQELLCERISYDKKAFDDTKSSDSWDKWTEGHIMYCQSIMSVFSGNRKKSVCAGYSKSMTALTRIAGMEACSITSENHEWNKIYMQGRWYASDTTWNDTDKASVVTEKYFLKSDKALNDDMHEWEDWWDDIAPRSGVSYVDKYGHYNIEYKLNGGKNSRMNPKQYTKQSGEIKLYNPEKEGYKFDGWYDNSEFEGNKITSIPGTKGKDITLYAKWKKAKSK